MMQCIEDVVGVTRGDCGCDFQGATPEEIEKMKKSTSGLYLDEVAGGLTLRAVKSAADCTTLAKVMLTQLQVAGKLTYDAIRMGLSTKYDQAKAKYDGTIGEYTFARPFAPVGKFAGLRLKSNSRDGIINLRRITLIVDASAVTDVYVIRVRRGASSGEVVFLQENVNTTAFAQTSINLPPNTALRTYEDYAEADYFVLFDTKDGAIKPVDNKVSCNCGDKNVRIHAFVVPNGVSVQSLTGFDALGALNEYACGVVLDVQMVCGTSEFFCRQYDDREEIAIGISHAVLYKAAELTIEYILKSPEISRFTMQNREYLWGKRNHFKAEFNSYITYIVNEAKIYGTDCFVCKQNPTNDIRLTGILS
jgi:hypothetical protein